MSVATPAVQRVTQPVRRALRNDFIRHSALVFGAAMAGNIFNYLFNFALSRRLGVEGFATLSSLISFLMILSIPTVVLSLIIVKYAAVYHAAGDSQRIRRLSELLLKWTTAAAVLICAAGLLLRGYIGAFLHIADQRSIMLALGIMAVGVITPSVRSILQGEQDFVRFSVSTLLETFLKVLFAVALVYAGFGLAGAMAGWFGATALALAYTVWAVLRKHGARAGAGVRLGVDRRRLTQTTFGVGFAPALLTFMSFMDVLLVKHYFSAHQAGLYAAVNLTGKIVLFLVGFVPAVMLPKAVAKHAKEETSVPLFLQALTVTVVMSGAALIAFGAIPGVMIRLVAGGAFGAGAPYVLQYDSAMCILAIVTLLVNYKIGIHRFDFLYGLAIVGALEVVAIARYHASLWDVVHILLLGNALAAAVCCYRIVPLALAKRVAKHA